MDGIKVTYKDGSVGRIRAREEVILCAGAINTPQLLLLSGIGSADDLDKFQVMDRPIVFLQSRYSRNVTPRSAPVPLFGQQENDHAN